MRKALWFLHESNPQLLKWLKQPALYSHDPVFVAESGRAAGQSSSGGSSRPIRTGSKLDEPMTPPGEVEDLNGFFRSYPHAA